MTNIKPPKLIQQRIFLNQYRKLISQTTINMASVQHQLTSKVTPTLWSSITVFTDVGVKDIDDELLLSYLFRTPTIENSMGPPILDIVFCGSDGVSPQVALGHWKKYEAHLLTKFSHNNDEGYLQIQGPYILKGIRYHTIDEFREIKVDAQFALQISPMNNYDGSNLTVEKKYVFAGDFVTPEGQRPSFNRAGAEAILDRFESEGKLVDISSQNMATMRFNPGLVQKFDGPFLESVVFTGFLLAFARMSPEHGANKFAEGLVNPNTGRGANFTSVMNMAKALDIKPFPEDHFAQQVGSFAHQASVKYFDDLEKNGVALKDKEGSIRSLTTINYILEIISERGGSVEESIFKSGSVFVSDFDMTTIPDVLKPSFEYFKKNADKLSTSYNPTYDVFAGYVLVGLIKGEDRKAHTREEFLKNIVTEF